MRLVVNEPQASALPSEPVGDGRPAVHELELRRISIAAGCTGSRVGAARATVISRRARSAAAPLSFAETPGMRPGCYKYLPPPRLASVPRARQATRALHLLYHGWTYDRDGARTVPANRHIRPASHRANSPCRQPPGQRVSGLRVPEFRCRAPSLDEYLGAAKEYIDLVIEQSPSARGGHRRQAGVHIKANWSCCGEQLRRLPLLSTHSTGSITSRIPAWR